MILIEALKKVKDLQIKADDIKTKIAAHSAYLSNQTPVYADQQKQVAEWLQAHSDILKEILRLRVAIQKTNLITMVPIELGGKTVVKSIAEWVHRRRDLAAQEEKCYKLLTDRGLREGITQDKEGNIVETVKIIRCYDTLSRDIKIEEYRSEPTIIDGKLEIINATTPLIED